LAAVHPQRRTPHVAVAMSTVIVILMAVALPIEKVAAATDLMFLFLFLQVNTALIVLRKRRPDLDRGFRVPLVPYVPLVANVTLIALIGYLAAAHHESFLYAVGWVLAGLVIHRIYAGPREKEIVESKVAYVRTQPHTPGYAALVALSNPAHVPNLMAVACAAAKRRNGHVVAVSVIRVPSPTPLEAGWSGLGAAEAVLADALAEGERWGVPVLVMARVGRSVPKAILDVIESHQIDLLVLGWRGYSADQERVLGTTLDPLVRTAPTDIAVLKAPGPLPGAPEARSRGFDILCPTTGSKHGALGMELASSLAEMLGGRARYLHIKRPEAEVAEGVERLIDGGVRVEVVESTHVEDALARESAKSDLLVIGASRESMVQLLMFGSMPETIARQTETPVLLVKRYAGRARGALRELFRPLEPEEIAVFEQHQPHD
jgi:APA family basic amino acid/polyamine antiporter